jgi:hypothetical protein
MSAKSQLARCEVCDCKNSAEKNVHLLTPSDNNKHNILPVDSPLGRHIVANSQVFSAAQVTTHCG